MELADAYSLCKSLHLIGMVSWFAGMFYLVRIFVNHAESNLLNAPEKGILHQQFNKMEWKVYRIIMNPALIFTWSCGCTMLSLQPVWLYQPWMHLKLFCLVLLTGYHHYCKTHIKELETGISNRTSLYFRVLNEVPTLFLITIIFLAVFKQRINFVYLALGIFAMIGMIALGIYRVNKRNKIQ
jgi:protoporphyrinogen IX oxidase